MNSKDGRDQQASGTAAKSGTGRKLTTHGRHYRLHLKRNEANPFSREVGARKATASSKPKCRTNVKSVKAATVKQLVAALSWRAL